MTLPPTISLANETTDHDERVGEVLESRYRLESIVGRGGMATVYRALDLRLHRYVAVKMLRDSRAGDAVRFRSEIETLARLSHPSLVRILDAGGLDERPFLVMELIEGSNLAQLLATVGLRAVEVASIGADVAAALAYVHENGVVHRDVKPANVLIDRLGGAHLADFGVAQLAETPGLTTTGLTVGTPAYLAPEQIEGRDIGASVDVYALGLVLIECLSGRRAFEGTPAEITGARLHRDPVLPATLSEQWRHTLSVMTARRWEQRPSARDAAAQLSGLRDADVLAVTFPRTATTRGDDTVVVPFVLDATQRVVTSIGEGPAVALSRSSRRWNFRGWWRKRRSDPTVIAAGAVATLVAVLAAGALVLAAHSASPKAATGAGVSPARSTTTSVIARPSPTASDAQSLVAMINRDVANGSVAPAVGQQLTRLLAPLLLASTTSSRPPLVADVQQFAQSLSQAVNSGAVVGTTTVTSLTSAFNTLAATVGVGASPVPTVGVAPGPVGPGHGHGHGNGGNH